MAEYKLGFYGEEIDLKLQEIETLKNQIIALQGNIGQLTANNETITDAIEALSNAASGAIRHIQRGVTKATVNGNFTISLSGFTNAEKMIVLFDGVSHYASGTEFVPYLVDLTADTMTIWAVNNTNNAWNFSYQVIEFY